MPTNTDLVTDLPADFAVFGQAVDTSMADLKGGTTGQILSKATNTDMDFTWITNDVGDITAVTATSPLTGGGTSGAITVGIQDATTSVKGSVQLSDSTSTTSSVLAATPTAVKSAYDLAALASPAAAAFYAGKNRVLNSNFSVWQRGTTGAGSTTAFVADRWNAYRGVAGSTYSRQVTGDTTNLPFIQYCQRVQRDSGNTSTSALFTFQNFESINSIPLAGKAVVFSFYARAGANFSAASNLLTAQVVSGTGTDQSLGGGYTGQANVVSQTPTLTTTWQRFTYTGTVATTATQVGILFSYTPVGTAGTNDYFEITGVQLEVANTASPYAPNTSTYQAELAACQRYYYRIQNGQAYSVFGAGAGSSATVIRVAIPTHTTMRVYPSAVDYSGVTAWDYAGGAITFTSLALANVANNPDNPQIDVTGTGITTHRPYYLVANNNANAYLGLSAEL